ncbi:MAG: nucleoside-diphosphate sugar epimerase/dehydratase, partial [Syntrophomonadaceae bacterium]|nr:nucleoside-diphosphate sugar epimerase/dehydratase [Syntrophomonadaceae bacterium]
MSYSKRNISLLIIDALLINLAVYTSLLLRFDGQVPAEYSAAYLELIPFFTLITLLCFAAARLYQRIWEYASIDEMLAILKAVTYSVVIVAVLTYLSPLPGLPRSVYILSWLIINVLIGSSRLSWRLFRDVYLKSKSGLLKNLLIIGAGDAGAMLVREIHNNSNLTFNVVGFVDDAPAKQKAILHGVKVLGTCKKIPEIVRKHAVQEIIVAMPSEPGETIRKIVDTCRKTSAKVKILPGIYQSTSTNLMANIRDIQMEDLLRRKPVVTDLNAIAQYISNKSVLITGAGGSIGSELCRQVLKLAPQKLIMIDNCENNLFEIEQELVQLAADTVILPQLLDIRDRDKLEKVFLRHRPQVVFHAAAYKHVPMLELHPDEAISNNVIGTRNAAELADQFQVDTFISVSTDKAVNPTSVMGASKRIVELIIKDINRKSKTQYAAVRFGNVLGSRGSVIPTFQKQIKKGGPVTVTHPDMERFFMTIPEAVQLIIQAGALAKGGEIFVLDMGQMVKIDDLARDLIKLSGYEP